MENNFPYEDIISLEHPTSKHHPRMSLHDRAAQFAPFAALTGHEAAIEETARRTETQIELTEEAVDNLNEKLCILRANLGTTSQVEITYFVPDERKAGGAYLTHAGVVRKMDEYAHSLLFEDGTVIPAEQILAMEGEMFAGMEYTE